MEPTSEHADVDNSHPSAPIQKEASIGRHHLGIDRHTGKSARELEKDIYDILDKMFTQRRRYSSPPRHLYPPISTDNLRKFVREVAKLPPSTTFEQAAKCGLVFRYFKDARETDWEIRELFEKAKIRSITAPPQKVLTIKKDPGRFSVPCSILGVEFRESLVDSGACVNVMTSDIARKLGAEYLPSTKSLTFADGRSSIADGQIQEVMVEIGDCLIPTAFQIVNNYTQPMHELIFGRPFMATAGAILDYPNNRISFANINEHVFYEALPARGLYSQIYTLEEATEAVLSAEISTSLKDEETVSTDNTENRSIPIPKEPDDMDKEAKKAVPKKKRQKGSKRNKSEEVFAMREMDNTPLDPGATYCTMVPTRCDGHSVHYKVKYRGFSTPFAKARIVLTPELKEKGPEEIARMLNRSLVLEISSCRTRMGVSSQPRFA